MPIETKCCPECKGIAIFATHKWTLFGRVYEECKTCDGKGWIETKVAESTDPERKPVAGEG